MSKRPSTQRPLPLPGVEETHGCQATARLPRLFACHQAAECPEEEDLKDLEAVGLEAEEEIFLAQARPA